MLGRINFPRVGRHLLLGPSVKDIDLIKAHSPAHTGRVDGCIAPADNDQLALGLWEFSQGLFPQKGHAVYNPFAFIFIFSRNPQFQAAMTARADEYRVKVLSQVLKRDVFADAGIVLDINSHVGDEIDLTLKELLGQAVLRDTHP